MPTNRSPRLRADYRPAPDHGERLASLYRAIQGILAMDIIERHKYLLLDRLMWEITQVDGKWTTRYRSQAAMGETLTDIQHEHVIPRKTIVLQLLENPGSLKEVLDQAVACVVTKEEHERLTAVSRTDPSLQGWDRYRAAGVEVMDMATRQRVT